LTKTIENLALETSLLKMKIGFQFDHRDDMFKFLMHGKEKMFEGDGRIESSSSFGSEYQNRKRSRVDTFSPVLRGFFG